MGHPDTERANQLLEEAKQDPTAVSVYRLRELLDSSEVAARVKAALALVKVAEEYPEDVCPAVDTLQPLLADDHRKVRLNAASALVEVAEEYPEDVRQAVDALQSLLTDDHRKVRLNAASALSKVAEEYPEDVRPAVDTLQSLLADDHNNARSSAALALSKVAEEYPEDVRPAVDALQSLLADDHNFARSNAAEALGEVAEEYPEDVRPAVGALQSLFTDDYKYARSRATWALSKVAEEYPEDVRPAVNALQSLLADDYKYARSNAVLALKKVAEKYPEDVRPAVDTLQSLLADDYKKARSNAALALVAVAEKYPEDVRPAVDALQSLLADDHNFARSNAALALKKVAEEYPEDVRPVVGALKELLTDDHNTARSNAAEALGEVAEEYPEAVQQTVETLADLLDDAEAGEKAEEALTAVADGGDTDLVRQAVEDKAPDRLDDILEDTHAHSTRQSVTDASEGISMDDSLLPDLETVASPPRQSIDYTALSTADEPIGAGGQAVVYEATLLGDSPPNRVALKEPNNPGTMDYETVDTFLQEAATWETVDRRERQKPRWADSEYIAGIIDTGDELPWIAMEYMDGGGLDDRLDQQPDGLPLAEALWIGECICRGVELAHNYGIAHLDLKPANVLFRETPDGTWDVPKVADWGLARVLAEQTGTMEGLSVKYAAPEQFEPDDFGDPDMLTDVYQIGALIYALLTGEPPYTGSQTSVMFDVVRDDGPTPPSNIRDDVPEALDTAVQTALARSKADRYRSIAMFARALREIRTG